MASTMAMRSQGVVGAPVQRRQLTHALAGQPLVRLPQLQQHRIAARVGMLTMAAAATEEAAVAPVAAPQENTEAVAHLRYYRMQPSKIRVILDQIRGRTYEDALMILEYMPHRACEPILKLLVSAAANAKQNLGLRKSKLVVSECYANEGPVLKRFQPRAKGRAYRINKYLTHITIKVKERA